MHSGLLVTTPTRAQGGCLFFPTRHCERSAAILDMLVANFSIEDCFVPASTRGKTAMTGWFFAVVGVVTNNL